MEILIKYCQREHNICQGCDTLRLGTLDYYKKLDSTFTGDPTEATFELTNAGNPLALSIDQTEKLTDGRWTGAGDSTRQLLKVEKGGKLIKSVKFPNCYIFCTCRFHQEYNKKEFAKKFDPNYDSSYMITNVPMFTRSLAEVLLKHVKLEDLSEDDAKKLSGLSIMDIRDIGLQIYSAPVVYTESKEKVFSQENFEESLKKIPNQYQVLFLKENKYSFQREFRFVFAFSHPVLGILSVKEQPKTLNLNPLSCFLKDLSLEK